MKHIVGFEPPNLFTVKMLGEFEVEDVEPMYEKMEEVRSGWRRG